MRYKQFLHHPTAGHVNWCPEMEMCLIWHAPAHNTQQTQHRSSSSWKIFNMGSCTTAVVLLLSVLVETHLIYLIFYLYQERKHISEQAIDLRPKAFAVTVNMMFVLQVRSHSSVSSVSAGLPTAVTGRSTRRFTRHPNPTTARPWAVPSPTPTPAPCASTWRFTSSRRLPLSPRIHMTPSHINFSRLTRLSLSP